MSPDARTLFAIIALLSLGAGFVLLAMWTGMRERGGLRTWAMSHIVRAPGFFLLLGRGDLPFWLTIDVSNALILLGSGLGLVAARELSGARFRTRSWSLILFGPAIGWLAACQIPVIYEDVVARTVAVAAPLAIYAFATAIAFLGLLQTSIRVRAAFCVLWTISALGHATRIILVIINPPDQNLTRPDTLFTITLLIPIATFATCIFLIGFLYKEWRLTELQRRADRDCLTGVLNRNGIFRAASNVMLRAGSSAPCAVLLLDLDHFKTINDRLGHAVGDRVLIAFCRVVEPLLPHGAIFGRLGGEEFSIFCNGSEQEVMTLGETLRRNVAETALLSDGTVAGLTVSIGVAVSGERAMPFEDLLAAADAALYEGKRLGRNKVCLGRRGNAGIASPECSGAATQLAALTAN